MSGSTEMEDSILTNAVARRVPKILTAEEMEKLASDEPISAFKQRKLEQEARKNWDLFYKRNETKFFKDRHWTKADLQQLCADIDFQVWNVNVLSSG